MDGTGSRAGRQEGADGRPAPASTRVRLHAGRACRWPIKGRLLGHANLGRDGRTSSVRPALSLSVAAQAVDGLHIRISSRYSILVRPLLVVLLTAGAMARLRLLVERVDASSTAQLAVVTPA